MNYEYTICKSGSQAELLNEINRLGAEEWELTSVVVDENNYVAFLKRELKDRGAPDVTARVMGGSKPKF